jgi:hypothetical protein
MLRSSTWPRGSDPTCLPQQQGLQHISRDSWGVSAVIREITVSMGTWALCMKACILCGSLKVALGGLPSLRVWRLWTKAAGGSPETTESRRSMNRLCRSRNSTLMLRRPQYHG